MSSTTVQVNIKDGIAVLTIDLPGSKVNVLSRQVMADMRAAISQVRANGAVKGMIICSGKPGNFVVGADIAEIQKLQNQPAEKAFEAAQEGKELLAEMKALGVKVVGLVNGLALGGGAEILLYCHEVLAVHDDAKPDTAKAMFGFPEVKLGVFPGFGGTVYLTRRLGIQKAIELVSTGKTVDARKAWKLGLVSELVAPAEAMQRACEVALGARTKRYKMPFKARLLRWALEGNPLGRKIIRSKALQAIRAETRGNYPAPEEALKVIFTAATRAPAAACEAESRAFAQLAVGQVSKNLVGVYFAQQKSKKAPSGAACDIEIKKVGVFGAGVMGAEIAYASAVAGYDVVLYDLKQDALKRGMDVIRSLFDKLVSKGKLSRQEAEKRFDAIKPTVSYSDFADCELVVEAVPESMYLKRLVRHEGEKVIAGPFIFCSNTSSLVISKMAEQHVPAPGRQDKEKSIPAARDPDRVAGLHFFNPVHRMPLVEVVKGEMTSDSTLAGVIAFASKLGKTTVVSRDSAAFIVNRILLPYLREAVVLMADGVPIPDIDRAMKSFGMPMGPLELLDTVGLDIASDVSEVGCAAFGPRLSLPPVLTRIKELKLLGKKGGKGIYLYDAKTGKRGDVNPDVLALISAERKSMVPVVIQDRLVLPMLNEAVCCLQDGVNPDADQIDLAMIFGTGFPAFLGGPLRYLDTLIQTAGGSEILRKLNDLYLVAGDNYKPAELLVKKVVSGQTFYAG